MISSASNPTAPEHLGATSVYKYYDAHGVLIYVGITKAGVQRNRQHNADKAWWPYVVRQEVEHFPSRETAHGREIELIQRFRPPFNVQHNPEHAQLEAAYRALIDSGRFGLSMQKLITGGGKGTISLYPVQGVGDATFVTLLEDAPIARALTIKGERVTVLDGRGSKIGIVKSLEHALHTAKLEIRIDLAPPKPVIREARAVLRYVSLKSPEEVRIRRLLVR